MNAIWPPALVGLLAAGAVGLRFSRRLRSYQFTAWIVAVAAAALLYPQRLLHVHGWDMRNPWILLLTIQLVMFAMGTQMSLRDFAGVMRAPRGVIVAVLCQFSIMPLVAWALTKLFGFPPEIAAGVILIGSCSSGLSSNVMAFIARSNLALSVTVTAITTLCAPLMTPFWMKLLAGTLVPISYVHMMVEIIKIVLVPIGAALVHDYLKQATPRGKQVIAGLAALAIGWLLAMGLGGWNWCQLEFGTGALTVLGLAGFLLVAPAIGLAFHALARRLPGLEQRMPILAIAGILYVTGMTMAAGRDNIMQVGALLFLASVLLNLAGYSCGYGFSRACGLDVNSARSVAFEVGLQNGGMASGLASAMGRLGTVGLAAAIFIPWMNISGSLLANYWHRRPVAKNT
jgi:BASS family bile acid:Na+ symporter